MNLIIEDFVEFSERQFFCTFNCFLFNLIKYLQLGENKDEVK